MCTLSKEPEWAMKNKRYFNLTFAVFYRLSWQKYAIDIDVEQTFLSTHNNYSSVVPISHYHGDQYQDKFVRKGQERCSRKLGVEEVSRDGSKYLTQIYVELTIDRGRGRPMKWCKSGRRKLTGAYTGVLMSRYWVQIYMLQKKKVTNKQDGRHFFLSYQEYRPSLSHSPHYTKQPGKSLTLSFITSDELPSIMDQWWIGIPQVIPFL